MGENLNVRRSLKTKFVLWIVALVFFILVITSWFSFRRQTDLVTYGMDQAGLVISSTLAVSCPEYFFRLAYDELNQMITFINEKSEDIIEIYVLDGDWMYVAHSSMSGVKSRLGDTMPEEARKRYTRVTRPAKLYNLDMNGSLASIEYVSPIRVGSSNFGYVVVCASALRYKHETASTVEWTIYVALIALFSGLVLAWFLGNFITRNVKKLTEGVEMVARGDLSYRLNIRSSDEIGLLSIRINEMIQGLQEKMRMARFVSETVTNIVKSDTDFFEPGGEERKVTVLFADIRGFTTLSEKHPPDAMVTMLNDYLECMTDVIRRNNGVVDKFIGDAIMAIFYPEAMKDDEIRAATAAMQMMEELRRFNARREAKNLFTIAIGVGINTGNAIAGMIGSRSGRLDYTVIGDMVNVASRLEGKSKEGKYTRIVLSEQTFTAIKHMFDAVRMESDRVKGKDEQVNMYEITCVKDINLLVAELSSPEEKARYTAANLLGLTGKVEMIESLIPLLKDSSPSVRIAAQISLKHLLRPENKIVKYLVPLLEAEHDSKVLSSFISDIGILGDDTDRLELMRFIDHDDDRVRANTIEAIGLIKNLSTLFDLLKSKLKDPNNRNRANAAIRLYQLGDLEGLRTLLGMCRDIHNPLMRASGAYGIGEITSRDRAVNILEGLGSREGFIDEARLKLIDEGRVVLESLLSDSDMIVRVNAARALGRMGNSLSLSPLVAKFRTLRKNDPFRPLLLSTIRELSSPHVFRIIEKEAGEE